MVSQWSWSHFFEDLDENLLPQMPDKVGHNTIVGEVGGVGGLVTELCPFY